MFKKPRLNDIDQALLDRALEDAAKISRRLVRIIPAHNARITAMKLTFQLRALGARWKEEIRDNE